MSEIPRSDFKTATERVFRTHAELFRKLAREFEDLAAQAAALPPPTPVPLPPHPEYLTTKQVAVLLGVSTKGLENMRAQGRGPKFVRIGNRVRYLASELPRPRT